MPVIGFLSSEASGVYVPMATAFRQSLSESGYVEGRNKAERPAGPAGHEVRSRHQFKDRQGAWPRHTFAPSTARRRGDRIERTQREGSKGSGGHGAFTGSCFAF